MDQVKGTLLDHQPTVQAASRRTNALLRGLRKHRSLYLMLLPGLLYFLVFRYGPLWYAQIAFKDYSALSGVAGSPWAGVKHFEQFFHSYYFTSLLSNTLILSLGKLLIGLPVAIILAVALYESTKKWLARTVQAITFLPHVLSWVVMFGVLVAMLSPSEGLVNQATVALGGHPTAYLSEPSTFRWVVILSDIFKETGWAAVLFLAALLTIDPALYEAAEVDGASRLQRIWHISLPGILGMIVLVTLLRIGNVLDAGFAQVLVLYSLPVYSVGDIIDTWVYRQGLLNFQFSLATAVGLFKGVFGLALILIANRIARRFTGQGLF